MAIKASEREGKRHSISLRVTAEVRKGLEAAASTSGRSMTQEAEFRLEQSFLAGDVLEKLFGGPNSLKFFLRRALAVQQMVAERRDGSGDAWVANSDQDFRDQIADEFQQALDLDYMLQAPLELDEVKATRSQRKTLMPNGLSFATPEEAAQAKPVKIRRLRKTE